MSEKKQIKKTISKTISKTSKKTSKKIVKKKTNERVKKTTNKKNEKRTKKTSKISKKLKSSSTFIEFKGFLSFLILHELNKSKLCGDELAEKIGKRKGSYLTPGTIYPALKNLRENKLIKYYQEGRKKIYILTPKGKKELKKLYKLFSKYFQGLKSKISAPKKKKLKKKQLEKPKKSE